MSLWLVEIDEADWDFDNFEVAAVWAKTAEAAKEIARAEYRYKNDQLMPDELWIKPEWRLHVRPAPTEGVALVHWHAG